VDTLTHSLLGALAVRVALPAARSRLPFSDRRRMLAGAVGGAFPDIDYATVWIDPLSYLAVWHRGITHSLLLLPLWALLLGVAMAWLLHRREAWKLLTLSAAVALATHIAADVITVFGTRVLAPLSDWRAALGTTFIIDLLFSGIVLTGFVAALYGRPKRLPAVSLVVLLLYIGAQAWLKHSALQLARQRAAAQGLEATRAHALPQPFSPFFWKLVTVGDEAYEVAYVNLRPGTLRTEAEPQRGLLALTRHYRAPGALHWRRQTRFGDAGNRALVRRLWSSDQMSRFRDFAVFPVLYRVDDSPAGHCVWFTDMRFELPFMAPPFRYGLCGSRARGWRLRRLGY